MCYTFVCIPITWSVCEKGEILIGVCARVKKRDCERGVYESDAFGIGLVIFI